MGPVYANRRQRVICVCKINVIILGIKTNSFSNVWKSSNTLDLLTFRCFFWNLERICIYGSIHAKYAISWLGRRMHSIECAFNYILARSSYVTHFFPLLLSLVLQEE